MISFIAEIGSNHNCDYNRAIQLIDKAHAIGFTHVKFQLYTKDLLYAKGYAPVDLIEFPLEWLPNLYKHCLKIGIKIGYSIFHECFIEKAKPYANFLKISSWDVLRLNLIEKCVETELPLIISLGGTSLSEITAIMDIVPYHKQITFLHCIPKYPCKVAECNLGIIRQLCKLHDFTIGWSDHSANNIIIHTAISMGASIIEMHLDLDDMEGYEPSLGHVWTVRKARYLIQEIITSESAKGQYLLKDNEKLFIKERLQRADRIDGLRPTSAARI